MAPRRHSGPDVTTGSWQKRTPTFVSLVIKELGSKPRSRLTGESGMAAQARRSGLVEPLASVDVTWATEPFFP